MKAHQLSFTPSFNLITSFDSILASMEQVVFTIPKSEQLKNSPLEDSASKNISLQTPT